MARDRYDYVIVGGGSAGCALANRLSTDPVNRGARAGGGPQRLPVRRLRPHARGAHVPERQPALRLALRVRAGAAPAQPAGAARPGQGARRLQQHQRHDLPAGQPDGLRAVGRRPRHGQLGLRPLPALLHAHGELPRRRGRRRVPRAQRPARDGARARHQPAVRRVPAGGAGGGLPADRRRQRVPAGGLRPVRPQRLPRTAAVGGRRVPAPGDVAAEPRGAHERAGHEGGVRGQPGGRRRVHAVRPRVGAAGGRGRGRAGGRRDQLAAAAAAVRGGRPDAAARPGHPGGRRRARRGREPPGPPGGVRAARVHAAGVDAALPREEALGGGRRALAVPAQRARRHQPLRGGRLRPQQRRRRLPEPDVPLPADRGALRRHRARGRARLPGARRADVLRRPRHA